jgi:hypothetical protein
MYTTTAAEATSQRSSTVAGTTSARCYWCEQDLEHVYQDHCPRCGRARSQGFVPAAPLLAGRAA